MKKICPILIILFLTMLNVSGQVWNPLGGTTSLGSTTTGIRAIAVSPNDGSIYAGGTFASGVNYLAKYNTSTSTWQQVGTGINGPVYALAFYKNNLYVGGLFTVAGGVTVKNIASVSSTGVFSDVAGGVNDQVNCLYVAEDSSKLYVAGKFNQSGSGTSLLHIASIATTTWAAVGAGVPSVVNALAEYTSNGAKKLYAGTENTATPVYKDSSNTWYAMPDLTGGRVNALAAINGYLYAGGEFSQPTYAASKWNGGTWSTINTIFSGPTIKIYSFYKLQTTLFLGGTFSGVGVSGLATYIGRIDGPTIPIKAVLTGNTLGGAPYAINSKTGYIIAGGMWSGNGSNISISSTTIGIEEIASSIESSTLFPNPITDHSILQVKLKKHFANSSLLIYNNQGQLVKEKFEENILGNDLKFEIEKNELRNGIYHYLILLDGSPALSTSFIVD